MRALAFALVAVLLGGCPATDPTQGLSTGEASAVLDYNSFVCDVMPTLVRRCSYTACHGVDNHALRIYSPGKLRIGDPLTRDARDAPLTADEIERNFESAVGVARGASLDQRLAVDLQRIPLLQKPLAARFGGDEHQGIGVFPVYPAIALPADQEWQLLVNWVGGAKQPSPPQQSCKDFFTALGVPPK